MGITCNVIKSLMQMFAVEIIVW